MRLTQLRRLMFALLFAASTEACVTTGAFGPSVRTVTSAQRERNCSLLAVVVGSESRVTRTGVESESAMTEVRRKVVAVGGNAMYVLSQTTTGDTRMVTAEALSCRFNTGA